ncbi:helix-turn-helix domain-containing protein [Desulfurivibrio sp. C05AmB]|uniref:helix-turn-helix domain-containing protein n=1 Tax=Desulfurivibrio sp. C05AmB TaxID=3374371 RepID=UPI00376F1B8C
MDRCPICGHKEADATDRLRGWCRDRGLVVSFNDTVNEKVAAVILDRQPGTLRNWRCRGDGPPFSRRGGRAYYLLADLAEFMETEEY